MGGGRVFCFSGACGRYARFVASHVDALFRPRRADAGTWTTRDPSTAKAWVLSMLSARASRIPESSTAAELQAGLRDILAGGKGHGDADPFAARNEWEDTQHRLKRAEKKRPPSDNREKPRSRRAQQAAARAPRDDKAVEEDAPATGAAAKKAEKEPSFAPKVAPASRTLLPAVALWHEHLAAAPADAQLPSAAQAAERGRWRRVGGLVR